MPDNIEVKKTWLSPRARHMLDHLIRFLPLIALAVTMVLWVDTRYMHKQVSDIRYTNLQIQVLEGQVSAYHKLTSPTADETLEYERLKERLTQHREEWNDILGITTQ
jgi:hypothetical protein